MQPLTQKALDLIFEYEGLDQPGEWPGGESGITIGIGYDLGYIEVDEFRQDWSSCLSSGDCDALAAVVGLKSDAAKAKASGLKAIRINTDDARKVFIERSVPSYQAQTEQVFPGVNNLPPDAQGALVSLVYNRGTSLSGDRRREMRAIRDAVPKGDLREIANQLRSMKRLWQGTDVSGLVARREAEAQLVESCIT
jgi:GH24 family phage-related lysozyme (muramidase)